MQIRFREEHAKWGRLLFAPAARAPPPDHREKSDCPRPPRPEEFLQHLARLAFADAGIDFGGVVAGRLREQARAVEDGAAFGVGARRNRAARPGPARSRPRTSRKARASPTGRSRRAGSRRARAAARIATISAWALGSWSSRIAVAADAEHLAVPGHHRADRHFARLERRRAPRRAPGASARAAESSCLAASRARRPAQRSWLLVVTLGTGTWTLAVVVPTVTSSVLSVTEPLPSARLIVTSGVWSVMLPFWSRLRWTTPGGDEHDADDQDQGDEQQ